MLESKILHDSTFNLHLLPPFQSKALGLRETSLLHSINAVGSKQKNPEKNQKHVGNSTVVTVVIF